MFNCFQDGSYVWMQPMNSSMVQYMCKSEMKKIPKEAFNYLKDVWLCRKFDGRGLSIGWVFGFSFLDESGGKELDVIAKTTRDCTRVFRTLDAAIDYIESLKMFGHVRIDFG